MANQIRLKRGSGSDPSASDLATGELAVRTDTAKLFTKKDDGNVAEIGATVGSDSVNTAAIQDDAVTAAKLDSNAVVTASIVDDAVTFAKSQNIGTSKVLGRTTSGTGNIEELTAANIRSLINVEDGATADQTKSDIDALGIAASTAATLATARNIAGTSFNGSANIDISYTNLTNKLSVGDGGLTQNNFTDALKSKLDGIAASATNVTNNNQLTNGAGYITATLTNEQVQDIVGGMLSGNTETGITVTYQDGDGTIDFVVASQTDNNFTTTLKNKLDGIASGATNVTNTNQLTNGAGFITATLTNEQVQDIVGGMVSGNTESGITVTYQDSDGTLDFAVASQTDQNFTTTLKNKLDGIASGATNVTNNNQLTNGAGYITNANGGNAATLDSLDSTQFARSDTADTLSGLMTFSGGISLGADARCAAGVSSLSDGSTITVNFISGIHHSVTLGGNRTLSHSNTGNAVGQSGSIFITQDGTGSRTLSFNSAYKFVGGTAPTLSTDANAVDRIDYVIKSSSVIHCAFSAGIS